MSVSRVCHASPAGAGDHLFEEEAELRDRDQRSDAGVKIYVCSQCKTLALQIPSLPYYDKLFVIDSVLIDRL